ncbi:MAG TPA: hypothetical protein VH297_02825 [Gaiellaceae bacterium]|jgi:hypothetical protein
MRLIAASGLAALALCAGATSTGGATGGWCRAPQPASWHRVLTRSVVTLSRHASLLPIVGAHDGRSFFAQLYSPAYSGVVRIDARTSRITSIRRFPDPARDQADGSFDGRWLVWNEYHSLSDFGDFTTFAWDSRTGALRQIGAATRSPRGGFWDSPWRQPDVRDGLATWTQGSGPDGETSVHLYDIADHSDRIVHRGHAQGSFFVAGLSVVWPESLVRGAPSRMLAVNARTGKAVAPPRALARLRGISALFTDGATIAYPSAKFTSLWWARSLRSEPQRVFRAKPGYNHVDNSVRVSGRYFLFSSEGAAYVADTRAHRYMLLGGVGVAIDPHALVISSWTRGKALHPKNRIMFVPVRSLPPLARCAG